jgi:hypothetical protein
MYMSGCARVGAQVIGAFAVICRGFPASCEVWLPITVLVPHGQPGQVQALGRQVVVSETEPFGVRHHQRVAACIRRIVTGAAPGRSPEGEHLQQPVAPCDSGEDGYSTLSGSAIR